MSDFAKLFNTEKYGQIVVIQQGSDDAGGEIRFFFQPAGLGVCSLAMSFKDSDAGWDACDRAFEKVDEAMAINAVRDTCEHFLAANKESDG